jgi:hypothetical protein
LTSLDGLQQHRNVRSAPARIIGTAVVLIVGGAVRPAAAAAPDDLGEPAGIACAGDCNGDGRVSVDELVRAVSIALGAAPASQCPGLDANASGGVEVPEVIAAVGHALDGCGGEGESVCGGPITSAPKACELTITPRRTTSFGTLNISFALSDLEGDLAEICGALALQSAPQPTLSCDPLPSENRTVNEVLQFPPIKLNGAATGTYVLYLQLRDARGARSALISATFTVGVRL